MCGCKRLRSASGEAEARVARHCAARCAYAAGVDASLGRPVFFFLAGGLCRSSALSPSSHRTIDGWPRWLFLFSFTSLLLLFLFSCTCVCACICVLADGPSWVTRISSLSPLPPSRDQEKSPFSIPLSDCHISFFFCSRERLKVFRSLSKLSYLFCFLFLLPFVLASRFLFSFFSLHRPTRSHDERG